MRRSFRNSLLRVQHRLSLTRVEFNAICVAAGLLLLGFGADLLARSYSLRPSDRLAREDSLFFALAAAADTTQAAADSTRADPPKPKPELGLSTEATGPPKSFPKIDVNSATQSQLVDLPGIGPALALRIVEYRTHHGPFRSVDDLQRVRGIGSAKVARLRGLAIAGGPSSSP